MIETAGVPAGRLGSPAETASTIAYLCSQQAGYLTGHYIAVDGGHHRSAFCQTGKPDSCRRQQAANHRSSWRSRRGLIWKQAVGGCRRLG